MSQTILPNVYLSDDSMFGLTLPDGPHTLNFKIYSSSPKYIIHFPTCLLYSGKTFCLAYSFPQLWLRGAWKGC